LAPVPRLDGGYTVFGKVISGMDVVQKIEVGDRLIRATVKGDKP
jgi:peptidyl-prolyl cis-trans isomerase B (cyclophilin B)